MTYLDPRRPLFSHHPAFLAPSGAGVWALSFPQVAPTDLGFSLSWWLPAPGEAFTAKHFCLTLPAERLLPNFEAYLADPEVYLNLAFDFTFPERTGPGPRPGALPKLSAAGAKPTLSLAALKGLLSA